MDITGIPPQTTLLAEIESLKCFIEYFKVSITRDMNVLLKDYLGVREIGGTGFVHINIILSKLDGIITHNKVTKNRALVKGKSRFYIS